MQIRWNNILVLALLTALVVWLGKNHSVITAAVESVGNIGRYHNPDNRVANLLNLGIICVTLVAIVKLLTARGGK